MAEILRIPLVSTPQQKRPIAPVDYFSPPLTLGINPNASIAQLSDSAPQRKLWIHLDVYPNLLGTTLASGAPPTALELPLLSGRVLDSAPRRKRWQADPLLSQGLIVYDGPEAAIASLTESAPQRRKSLSLEQTTNLLTNTLGQGQAPTLGLPQLAGRVDTSAPIARLQSRAYAFDAPNLLLLTPAEALGLPLNAGRVDASAPILKYQVRVESLSRPITLGINPNALIAQLSTSAPPPKKSAYPFDPPNLIATTLAEQLELPSRAARIDWSAPEPKISAYMETPTNRLVITPESAAPIRSTRIVVVSSNTRRINVRLH